MTHLYPSSKDENWRFADIKSFCENGVAKFLNITKTEQNASTVLDSIDFDFEALTTLTLDKNGLSGADDLDISQGEFCGETSSALEALVAENAKKAVLNLKENSPKLLIKLDSSLSFSPSNLEINIAKSADAEIFVLQETCAEAFVDFLLNVNLGESSKLKIVFINNTAKSSLLYTKAKFGFAQNSRLELFSKQEGQSPSRVEYHFDLAEKGAKLEATCFMENHDKCLHNLNTYQMHKVGDTSSNLTLRNVLSNGAKATFAGFVKIEKDAQCTSAKQSCKTLLLDKSAQIKALPILEIEANDVECAHGCAVSMPDEEQIFYLKARGLSETQAKKLIAAGFVNFDRAFV
ncbi:MAG: SufD family Fe-S cluster assembly protein [Opitutales bacterium]